ncbi:MAG: hypothetical protein ABIH29_03690 [Candidatus Micrarchaeota archaeon]
MKGKKGFLFVVTVFLILSYILLSISVWVKAIESSERIYAEFYRESTVELAIEQIAPEKVGNLSHLIMERSLYNLNEHAMADPVIAGVDDATEFDNARGAMNELLINGSADPHYFTYSTGISAENSSMTSWVTNLNVSLLAIGIYIDEFEIYDFTLEQSAIDRIRYTYRMRLSMRDTGGRTKVSREYFIEDELNISGLVDPAIVRGSSMVTGGDQVAYRRFYFAPGGDYREPADMQPDRISGYTVHGGMGWLYGFLVSASRASSIDEDKRGQYILVGDFDDLVAADPDEAFGGYIVTSAPGVADVCGADGFENQEDAYNPVRHEGAACTDVTKDCSAGECTVLPFIEAEGFEISDAPFCPVLGEVPERYERCALFINENPVIEVLTDYDSKLGTSGSGIFDVESMRDFLMCGYYTHSPSAPSFLQRLFLDAYDRSSTEYGIETFVIGEYANHDNYDRHSRLDRELFAGLSGSAVRGMPGCKNWAHCSDEPTTGVFTLGADAVSAYGAGDIYCEEAEGCEE